MAATQTGARLAAWSLLLEAGELCGTGSGINDAEGKTRMIRSLIMSTVLLIVMLAMLAGDRAIAAQGEENDIATYCAEEAEFEMLQRINELRAENDLEPLTLSQPLGVASEIKASEMADQDYLAHISPDGQTPRELLEEVGYTYNTTIGENIAAGMKSAEATFEQWLNSPEHREIMLNEEFTTVGIGRAHNPEAKYDWYWAAEFGGRVGEPADPCMSATPESTPEPA